MKSKSRNSVQFYPQVALLIIYLFLFLTLSSYTGYMSFKIGLHPNIFNQIYTASYIIFLAVSVAVFYISTFKKSWKFKKYLFWILALTAILSLYVIVGTPYVLISDDLGTSRQNYFVTKDILELSPLLIAYLLILALPLITSYKLIKAR